MEQSRDLKLALASARAPRFERRVIPEHAELAPGVVGHIVIEPRAEFLFDKLVLLPLGDEFTGLTVESVRVGRKELLAMPMAAALFSRENVYPMPEMPPPKEPGSDIKELFLGMWNIMNDRPVRYGFDDVEPVDTGELDAPPGTTIGGGMHVRPDESIEVDVRNGRAESVTLGVIVVGTAQERSVLA